jgi:general secretion pathway protein G
MENLIPSGSRIVKKTPVFPSREAVRAATCDQNAAVSFPPDLQSRDREGAVSNARFRRVSDRAVTSLSRRGFTLIEMMIVMAIIVILIAVAVPFYQKAIIRAKESVLHSNLFAMRSAIDEYAFDKQKAPHDLQELVTEGYLRDVPRDPITQRNDSWKVIMEDAGQAVSAADPGIFDVRSGSDKKSLDGTNYSEW